jgi:hypothetical protein
MTNFIEHLKIDLLRIRISRINKKFNPERHYQELHKSITIRAEWRKKIK